MNICEFPISPSKTTINQVEIFISPRNFLGINSVTNQAPKLFSLGKPFNMPSNTKGNSNLFFFIPWLIT